MPQHPSNLVARPQNAAHPGDTTWSPTAWREHAGDGAFSDPLLELLASRFRLLGEPLRLKLLAALSGGELSVGELTELTQAGQPNVSKHLAALAQGGLVRRRKQGTSTLYAIADPTVFALCDAVCAGVQQQFATQAHELGLAGLPPELGQGRRRAPREDEEEATAGAADKG